jgi:hypothetical protein
MIDVRKLTETVNTAVTGVNNAVNTAVSSAVNTAVDTASKRFDVSKLDITKIDLNKFDVTKMELPKFDLPTFDLPKFEMPRVEMPVVPAEVDRVADLVRDVTYAGIGMWVVAAQKVDAEVRKLAGGKAA